MSVLHFGASLSSCLSLLFLLLALSSDYWISVPGTHLGLWKVCNARECNPLTVEMVGASLSAIRTFMFLGMIAGVVSLGGLCIMNRKPFLGNIHMSKIACYASFTAGLCVMIAMSIFTGNTTESFYGWSFGVGWSSFPLYLVTGYLAYVLHKGTASTA